MNKLSSKKMALYGLLLGGAVIGLCVDRLRGPSAAQAASPGAQVQRANVADPAAGASEVKGPAIARIFESDAFQNDSKNAGTIGAARVRDAFSLTQELKKAYVEETPEKKAEEARVAENEEELRRRQLEEFQKAHKLKGTTLRDEIAWAIIDDQVVKVGEEIDGFQLERVERYRVCLSKGDLQVTLALPGPF
jgi:hypothetical protein